MLVQQGVEPGQVHSLVPLHLGQLTGHALMAARLAQNGLLAAIDVHGAQFAGMVDPQDFGQASPAGAAAGAGGDGTVRHDASSPPAG